MRLYAAALLPLLAGSAIAAPLTREVDPFIGTGGHGHTFPAASMPFGMVQLGPDTRLEGWDGCSGYHHSDSLIYGFSHTHLSGTGVADYCDLLIVPTTGELRLNHGADGAPGYRSRFTHDRESAHPGFYEVDLLDSGVHAELTVTERAGFHRYLFPPGAESHVIVDLRHRDALLGSSLRFVGDREIEGFRRSKSWARDQRLFFVIRFSRPWRSSGLVDSSGARPGLDSLPGGALEAWADFGDGGGTLTLQVGLSGVDVEGARRNLDLEMRGRSFDGVRRAADGAWERELSKIRVEGGTASDRRVFYTALYHTELAPNLWSDVDGRSLGRDLEVHRSDAPVYTVFSLWDTFRGLHPLLGITHRKLSADFVGTFLRQYRDGGRLPVWELAANETDCMIGYHAAAVIADALAQGIPVNGQLALEAMVHSADEDRRGLASYKRLGFVAGDEEGESVSKTLEYAYDDWCIAQAALRLGRDDLASRFMARAGGWRNLWDPSSRAMRARLWGLWFSPFDPRQVNVHYTEGNAWQYSWFVPHDVAGLMRAHGGPAAFARALDEFFSAGTSLTGNTQADITGMIGQYAHGNEPSHHVAYLYAFAGQPWKTQALVHRIRDSLYTDGPDGLPGNEDCGQMSAWYVLSALGFYPVTPGSGALVLGTPLFDRATITLENGRRFVVSARRASPGARFVRGVRLGGISWPRSWITCAHVARGGALEFELEGSPGSAWATAPGDWPVTSLPQGGPPPVPFVASGDGVFRDRTIVRLGDADPDARIEATLEPGNAPTGTSDPLAVSADSIPVRSSATLRAIAIGKNGERSGPLVASFHRLPPGRTIRMSAKYNAQYSGGGDAALIDGLRGGTNFRNGRWQGYQGTDLEATVDLGSRRPVHRVSMGFLQDAWPWIFMPADVAFSASRDGTHWRALGTVKNTLADDFTDPVSREFAVEVPPTEARWIRARVRSRGPVPDWHPGHGSPSFFFTDEIVIE